MRFVRGVSINKNFINEFIVMFSQLSIPIITVVPPITSWFSKRAITVTSLKIVVASVPIKKAGVRITSVTIYCSCGEKICDAELIETRRSVCIILNLNSREKTESFSTGISNLKFLPISLVYLQSIT